MNDALEGLVLNENITISFFGFILNLFTTAVLTYLLGLFYSRNGNSLSNKKEFSKNLLLLAMVTMMVITIVKSSLALSLGLVGALSIVRFRTAIKEPEELTYLFLCIAIGLGLGADQRIITIIAFILIIAILFVTTKISSNSRNQKNLILSIKSSGENKLSGKQILNLLEAECNGIDLKRLDENKETIEISVFVEISSFDNIEAIKEALISLDKNINFTFIDNKGIINL